MEITEKLIKPINETKYLTSENTKRYRPIIRYMFEEYQAIKYILSEDDIFNALKGKKNFENYTMEMCKSDLSSLVEWGNLIAMQDTSNVVTIEAFKNRKYLYELTDYAVQIVRLEIALENSENTNASLDPSLFESIKEDVEKIKNIREYNISKVTYLWENIKNNFTKLNQKYQDYVKSFYGIGNDEMMHSLNFISKKNELISYLKDFIISMQINSNIIEKELKSLDTTIEQLFLDTVYEAQKKVVRFDLLSDATLDENILKARNLDTWTNFKNWFVSTPSSESEVKRIYKITNDIITKITKSAMQIAENTKNTTSRKQDYIAILNMFLNSKDISEANKISSVVFGLEHTKHFKGDFAKDTDSLNTSILDEMPFVYPLKPRVRSYTKAVKEEIKNHEMEKKQIIEEYLKKQKEEQELLENYIIDGRICFEHLPTISTNIRIILLNLLSRAISNEERKVKFNQNITLKLVQPMPYKECIISCNDGNFTMPAFVFEVC